MSLSKSAAMLHIALYKMLQSVAMLTFSVTTLLGGSMGRRRSTLWNVGLLSHNIAVLL